MLKLENLSMASSGIRIEKRDWPILKWEYAYDLLQGNPPIGNQLRSINHERLRLMKSSYYYG